MVDGTWSDSNDGYYTVVEMRQEGWQRRGHACNAEKAIAIEMLGVEEVDVDGGDKNLIFD